MFKANESHSWLAIVQNELGVLYFDTGRLEDALSCFHRFIRQRRAENAEEDVGLGLMNVGEVLLFQGKIDEAKNALLEAARLDANAHLSGRQSGASWAGLSSWK